MSGIIVGVDGSDHSRRALEWAVNEAAMRHAPLTVLTVNETLADFWGGTVAYPGDKELAEQTRKMVQEETDSVLEQAGEGSRPESVTVWALTGLPADALINAGKDADLIVVGSRGAGGFKRLLMGSVSEQVTHHAPCPVVVMPAHGI